MRSAIVTAAAAYYRAAEIATDLRDGRRRSGDTDRERGMRRREDLVDWVGGYPFEFARLDALGEFFLERGFAVERMRGGLHDAMNELLVRAPSS